MSALDLPIRTDSQAQQTAKLIRTFRERLNLLDLERTGLLAIVDEYERALITYHRRIRSMLAREAEETAERSERENAG